MRINYISLHCSLRILMISLLLLRGKGLRSPSSNSSALSTPIVYIVRGIFCGRYRYFFKQVYLWNRGSLSDLDGWWSTEVIGKLV